MTNFVSTDAAVFRGTWADYVSASLEAKAREWAEYEACEGDFVGSQESEIDRGGDPVGPYIRPSGELDDGSNDIPF